MHVFKLQVLFQDQIIRYELCLDDNIAGRSNTF